MKSFEVQSIEIEAPFAKAYDFIADANNLPVWTEAFKSVANGRAQLATPNGSVEIGLRVHDARAVGAIDWEMTFPDGSVAWAYSRVIPAPNDRSIYSFILMPPPMPLERLEGALERQSQTLRKELSRLAEILHS
ncbi:MAG: SRPBCC family protein [bacterium]